jgi:ABC-type nitrate/sulfonate/bicarbonate transport system substrate-binding protein
MPLMVASGKVDILKKDIFSHYVMPFIPHSFVVANPAFAARNPKIVAAFSRALMRADKLARENPQELIFVMQECGKIFDIPKYAVSRAWAEKSRDLFGDFHLTTLNEKLAAKGRATTLIPDLYQFQALLVKNHYLTGRVSLDAWKQYAAMPLAFGQR